MQFPSLQFFLQCLLCWFSKSAHHNLRHFTAASLISPWTSHLSVQCLLMYINLSHSKPLFNICLFVFTAKFGNLFQPYPPLDLLSWSFWCTWLFSMFLLSRSLCLHLFVTLAFKISAKAFAILSTTPPHFSLDCLNARSLIYFMQYIFAWKPWYECKFLLLLLIQFWVYVHTQLGT